MRLDDVTTEAIQLSPRSAKAQSWIDKVYDLYPQTWQNNHVMPLGGQGDDQQFAMFELVPSLSKRDAVEVKWFQAYPQRQGVGTRAMRTLQDLAQQDGIALTLYPWNKGQVSQGNLIKFYRYSGFRPTARGAKTMAWEPNVTEAKLTNKDPVEKWVAVFKASKHPKFAGKTPEQREKMARMAQYRAVQNNKTFENMDHSKDAQAVPELKAALLSRKKQIKKKADDKDAVYDIINGLMTSVAKAHGISGQKLHDMWVDQYGEIPDTWILHESALPGSHTPTEAVLAKQYTVGVAEIKRQLKKGTKVELEHTTDRAVAREIALDHLGENLYYYDQLKQAGLEEAAGMTTAALRDRLNKLMSEDQAYADATQRAPWQEGVWRFIDANKAQIFSDLGDKGNGDYPTAPFAAWLLVQHMDAHPERQAAFYKLLKSAIPNHPKLQFLRDRAAVNQWMLQHYQEPEYHVDGKPLANPTSDVRDPRLFKDAGIKAQSRQEALDNAEAAGNKLLLAAVKATGAKTQPSYTQKTTESLDEAWLDMNEYGGWITPNRKVEYVEDQGHEAHLRREHGLRIAEAFLAGYVRFHTNARTGTFAIEGQLPALRKTYRIWGPTALNARNVYVDIFQWRDDMTAQGLTPHMMFRPSEGDKPQIIHSFGTKVAEAFDKPYDLPKRWQRSGDLYDEGGEEHWKTIQLPSNKELKIQLDWEPDDRIAIWNFWVGNKQIITGQGDAFRIFATAIAALRQFVRSKKPHIIAFIGNDEDPSRIKMYDRLVPWLIKQGGLSGYVDVTDDSDMWPDSLWWFFDERYDTTGKMYVLASNSFLYRDGVDEQSLTEAKKRKAKTIIDGMIKTLIKQGRTRDEAIADLKKQVDSRFYEHIDAAAAMPVYEAKQRLDRKCWTGYKKQGTKLKNGVRVNNCVPNESVEENLTETRDAAFKWLKNYLPTWPDYVVRDWLYNHFRGDWDASGDEAQTVIQRTLDGEGMTPQTRWKFVPDFHFTFDNLDPDTVRRIKERQGGAVNPYGIPKDAERHATQATLAAQQGGVRDEPVILKKVGNKYELLEGWHRTIQHFKQFPNGYRGPAWIALDAKPVSENFADGKGPGRKGDSQRHGIPKKATMAQLEKAAKAPGRKGQLARWQINMRRGRKKAHESINETWHKSSLTFPDGPIYISDHVFQRIRKYDIDMATVAGLVVDAVNQYSDDIAQLGPETFVVKDRHGVGIPISKILQPDDSYKYVVGTVNPTLKYGYGQTVYRLRESEEPMTADQWQALRKEDPRSYLGIKDYRNRKWWESHFKAAMAQARVKGQSHFEFPPNTKMYYMVTKNPLEEGDGPPHGTPENELAMMKAGTKPAALIADHTWHELYEPIMDQHSWVVKKWRLPADNFTFYTIGQPGEEARIKRIGQLIYQANAKPGGFSTEYHRELGRLLGYSEADIDSFIKDIPS